MGYSLSDLNAREASIANKEQSVGIGKRLKETRLIAGLTQKELGERIGISASSIANYETGISHPKEPLLYALMNTLKIEPNFLFQDCVESISNNSIYVSFEEFTRIKKYRALDKRGREIVDIILETQFQYAKGDSDEDNQSDVGSVEE